MKLLKMQKGVAAVELGIVIVPLILLAFGTTELARAVYQYNTLSKATRDAARFLSQQGPGVANEYAVARCLAVHGNTACAGAPLVPGLSAAMVNVLDSSNSPAHLNQATGSGVVNLVTVEVAGYPFTSLVTLVIPSITFGPISTTMRQVL